MRAGLLGERLGHSFSPRIHSYFGAYSYDLFEVPPERLDDFMKNGDFDALNVTIPYKKAVVPYCAELTAAAQGIGCVNTLVRRSDGMLIGDNTDAAGFAAMLERLKVNPEGKKALVLGSGGASLTARHVLAEMGAEPVVVISRSGENNYENIALHSDAAVLVNCTPVGMYPNNGVCMVDLSALPALEAVLDMVYNPARTKLIQQAMERGIPCMSGLTMLVEQARRAAERFTGRTVSPDKTDEVRKILCAETQNIVLVGMPGCGKSSIGQRLAEKLGREFVDSDAEIVQKIGTSIAEYFQTHTEEEFRALESEALAQLGKQSGMVIATGGGCVTRERNLPLLSQNGKIFFIERSLALLPVDGRPLSQKNPLETLYAQRLPLYRRFADAAISNNSTIDAACDKIAEVFYEISDY